MTTTITLDSDTLYTLNLLPIEAVLQQWQEEGSIASREQEIQFAIDLDRDPTDPRELSEIPEVRLWFIRLDAHYPWMPILLDWEAGELARYVAMLVPHQFSPEGIQYNPEALEIFVMRKVFVLTDWMQQQGMAGRTKIKFMLKMLGYDLDDGLFELIERGNG